MLGLHWIFMMLQSPIEAESSQSFKEEGEAEAGMFGATLQCNLARWCVKMCQVYLQYFKPLNLRILRKSFVWMGR